MSDNPDPHDPAEIIPVSPPAGATPEGRTSELGLPESGETSELIERAKFGDAQALNELFARHHGLMVELARRKIGPRLRMKEEADDLAQTTFREATRDFGQYQYRGEGSFLRWLVQILQNKIRDKAEYYSAGKRDASLETALDAPIDRSTDFESGPEPPSPDLSVTRVVQRDERFQLLREALVELTPEHRQAITLVFFEGLSLREAGARMGGRSEDALRMLLRRAERKLGELIKRNHGEI